MKSFIKIGFSLLLLISQNSLAQSGMIKFTLNGKAGNLSSPNKAYLSYVKPDGYSADSAIIINGSFKFSGQIKSARVAYLVIGKNLTDGDSEKLKLYLSEQPIVVNVPGKMANAMVTGGPLNEANAKLQKELTQVNNQLNALNNELLEASPEQRKSPAFRKAIQIKGASIDKESRRIKKSFILHHPDALLSFIILKDELAGFSPDVAEITPIFNSLSPAIRSWPQAVGFGKLLEELKTTAIGAVAPEFRQTDTAGRVISLYDFSGKYVLVDFWASWCVPCRAENPTVVRAYQNYKTKGFEVLGVSLDEDKSKAEWLKAIKDDHLTWTQVSDLKGWDNQAAKLYHVRGIPQNFLIGPDGKIAAMNLRGEALEKKLAEIFK